MEITSQPFYEQNDHSGNLASFDGRNGIDEKGNLWVDGKKVKVSKKIPRPTLAGSLSRVKTRRVTGDLREISGVGGSINPDHQGINGKRPIERIIENKNG